MAATILVPLDNSRFGEHALPVAVGIARKTGARVHVVHCHEPPLPPICSGGRSMNRPGCWRKNSSVTR